jgi:hypothetical protein
MDPITLIVTALATGAVAAAKEVGGEAVRTAYNGLKALIVKKFGTKASVENAVAQIEQKPDSENRKGVLKEELETAGADKDEELLTQVRSFLTLLEKNGVQTGVSFTATNTGPGAIAQGQGAVAAGQGGVAVGGNVNGGIVMGNQHRSGGVDLNASGGTLNITGDIIGRNKNTQ